MKIFSLYTVATLILARLASARGECPLESDCIENLCTDIHYESESKDTLRFSPDAWTRVTLKARCKNDAGDDIVTSLDLTSCIANFDGMLRWADNGGFRCAHCWVFQQEESKKVHLKCGSCPKKKASFRGYNWSWIDLSYGIWVKDGVLGCYDHKGTKEETLKKLE